MVTVYNLILEELKYRNVMYYDRFGPFYIVSIGAHLFNLANKGEWEYPEVGDHPPPIKGSKVLTYESEVVDSRVHIMFVAPPGFGKTYFIEKFMEGFEYIF